MTTINSLDDFLPIVGSGAAGAFIIEQLLLRAKSEYHTQPIISDIICDIPTAEPDSTKIDFIESATESFLLRLIIFCLPFFFLYYRRCNQVCL